MWPVLLLTARVHRCWCWATYTKQLAPHPSLILLPASGQWSEVLQQRNWHSWFLSSILLPQSYRTIFLKDTASGNSESLMHILLQNASYHSMQRDSSSLRHWHQYNYSSLIKFTSELCHSNISMSAALT